METQKPRNNDISKQILGALAQGGLTPDEIALKLNLDVKLIRPRITALKQTGAIVETGERRKNASNRSPKVVGLPKA
jgi:predicted transcriptional regulator